MLKLRSWCVAFIVILISAACQPQVAEVGELPTLVQFPTATETPIASETPVPTNTPIPSNTPTETPTATETEIPTETLTPTASFTPFPSASVTSSQTFTPSPSPTPVASNTPLATRTPSTPVIVLFQSNTVNTDNGSPVTLRWEVQASSARIEVLDSTGTLIETVNINLVGTYTTNTPPTGNVVTYRLVATRDNEQVNSIITVDMTPACTVPWYFSNPPNSAGCPIAPPSSTQVTFQQFANGFMFRATVGGQNRVCGIQNNRNLYSCFSAQPFTGTPPATPQPGQLVPDPIFQHTFYNNLATGGFWYDIIGFATANSVITNAQQQVGNDGKLYIQLPNGIYGFDSTLTAQGAPIVQVGIGQ